MEKEKEQKKSVAELFEHTVVKKVEVNDELKKSFIAYAMAVNVSRAIPDVRDGLKPVHRRILFSMGELNNFHDKPYKKCARIVGEVMGKYHPHGDSSVYDALVRLAQDFSIREPLVDGHGNFGSVDGDSPAAQRYTEARLSKIAAEMLKDIDKETVDFYPNFDETLMQPVVLPAKFPNLLVNGADGIAVGMATNIPPHNLTEVINGVEALIDNPDIEIDELMKIIPAPDYPTGGIVMGRTNVKHAYRTGKGGIVVRGKAEIEEDDKGRQRIIITELPYQVNKANFIIQMADMVKNKRLEGISNIMEESDREGMRVVVEVKRDANAQVVLNSLYKHTMLQRGDGIIFLALVNNVPKVCNLKEMLYYYLEHQKDVLIRKTKFDLRKAEERAHIVRGLVIALASIDEVIETIKKSIDRADALKNLTEKFELDEIQANAILEMKLSKLTSLEVDKLNQELAELEKQIRELKFILDTPSKVLEIIRGDLEEIKQKYGTPRKTEISMDMGDIDIEDLIKEEDVVISMTHGGYIKRLSMSEYKAQNRGGKGIVGHKTKEDDSVKDVYTTSTHSYLMMFSNLGRVYRIKAYEIPEASKNAKGRAMVNLLQLTEGEKITTIVPVEKGREDGYLILATKDGLIKRSELALFNRISRAGKFAITLEEGDELVGAGLSDGTKDILIASTDGYCSRIEESSVRAMGRTARGVHSMRLNPGQKVVSLLIVDEKAEVITISEQGFGKTSAVSEFRKTKRNSKGVRAGKFDDKTGALVALIESREDADLIMVANNGLVIRIHTDQVKKTARNTKGVIVMRMKGDAKIISCTLVEREVEEEISEEDKQTLDVAAGLIENETAETEAITQTNANDADDVLGDLVD